MRIARRLAIALFILAVAAPSIALADTWQIDPAHTSVGFAVAHMVISKVHGQFDKTAGTIEAEPNNPASAKVDITIDASSIDTHVEMRDGHLKSPDFLDAAKFPTLTFKSTKVESADAGKWKMTGDLTIHGVTKSVVFDVDGPSEVIKDPMGKTRVAASASTTINRKDFGLVWNKAMDNGGLVVGDSVSIDIQIEATKS
jgi:polyisoprenoid-binding protein YceI